MSQWMTQGLHLQPQGDTDHSTSAALCPLAGLRKAVCSACEAGGTAHSAGKPDGSTHRSAGNSAAPSAQSQET